ncbi:4-(cytidine 5'-diphospho)-2-C-methyl-D-erythritol kinase [Daeguia caeni]|uniref:4-diphosphocytidyl-2-C-methyl-D-erythritol kinase n=1 Tax=Daeguia caeni TaxID=439612 RepID=A0ABV9H708_9HYPH
MEWLAPAKINLALHVTGQRADGYHLLDMLVVFACDGDRIIVSPADHDSFTVSGRFAAAVPTDERNLVIRARDALRAQAPGTATPVAIHLEKNLPIAAGIGGGSSDAAATMLALNAYWQLGLSFDTLLAIGLTLGADLPMCLHGAARGTPVLARGIGEDLSHVDALPALSMLLVNDGTPLATPDVFRTLNKRDNPALEPPRLDSTDALFRYLANTRNDLLPAALTIAPHIADVLALLRDIGADHAQMSGSGATCFALFRDPQAARQAAEKLAAQKPDWFIAATMTIASDKR